MNWTQEQVDAHQAKMGRILREGQQPEQEGCAMDSMAPPAHKPRSMNGTEQRYADYVLDPSQHVGEITGWMYEGLRFKLVDGAHYKPDFNVFYPDGRLVNIEIKGGKIHEATVVRLKVARQNHPWCTFELWQYKNKVWTEKVKA